MKKAEEGKIRLGGCVLSELDNDWYCRDCKLEWYDIRKKHFENPDNYEDAYSRGRGQLYERDKVVREKWKQSLYADVDSGGPVYPVMAIMNNGTLRKCSDINDLYDAERDGVKWMFDKKNVGIKLVDSKIQSNSTRAGSMPNIYNFLKEKGALDKGLFKMFKSREVLYDLVYEL